MTARILSFAFYTLFLITPLVWLPLNYELFEYNKMMFVYFLTLIIVASWVLQMIKSKQLLLRRTPLDFPILLFLGANIISTIFSVDPHISWWGYYTRLNGGLLSIITYTLLYYALVSNFTADQAIKFLKASVLSGLIVALYAIPEHFGVSPSCVILTGSFDAACWMQDVQSRVFATLGQTNWLAEYLTMLIFPTIYFVLTASDKLTAIRYTLYVILLYMALTFTYSRAGTLGFLGGLTVFLAILAVHIFKFHLKMDSRIKPLGMVLIAFLFVNLIFGSSLTRFKLFMDTVNPTASLTSSGGQLEAGGNESGQIRLVVWKGALEIFKHYPLFGSGVETFAYTYYNFRPPEHNYLSEWDFLYNKAHNEFLNYLANTGIAGFLSYMFLILAFIAWNIKHALAAVKHKTPAADLPTGRSGRQGYLLLTAILASLISYHIQNFFGFSVVIVAVFFYLFPALAFLITDKTSPFKTPSRFHQLASKTIYRRHLYPKALQVSIILLATMVLINLIKYYQADITYAQGGKANDQGEVGKAYNYLSDAVNLNPNEPLYRSDLGYTAAAAAVALAGKDSSLSAKLKDEAISETKQVLTQNPRNVSFYRTAIRTYYLLSELDQSYSQKTLELIDQTITMAPTDPKLPYHKSVILNDLGKSSEALELLNKTLQMKPDYRDARITLAKLYSQQGKKDQAIEELQKLLKINPQDEEVLQVLEEWKGK